MDKKVKMIRKIKDFFMISFFAVIVFLIKFLKTSPLIEFVAGIVVLPLGIGYILMSIIHHSLIRRMEHVVISKERKKEINRIENQKIISKKHIIRQMVILLIFVAVIINWCLEIKTKKYIYPHNYIPNEAYFIIGTIIYITTAVWIYILAKESHTNCTEVIKKVCKLQDATDLVESIKNDDFFDIKYKFEKSELLNYGLFDEENISIDLVRSERTDEAILSNENGLIFGFTIENRAYKKPNRLKSTASMLDHKLRYVDNLSNNEEYLLVVINSCAVIRSKDVNENVDIKIIEQELSKRYDMFGFRTKREKDGSVLIHCDIHFLPINYKYKKIITILVKSYEAFEDAYKMLQ